MKPARRATKPAAAVDDECESDLSPGRRHGHGVHPAGAYVGYLRREVPGTVAAGRSSVHLMMFKWHCLHLELQAARARLNRVIEISGGDETLLELRAEVSRLQDIADAKLKALHELRAQERAEAALVQVARALRGD